MKEYRIHDSITLLSIEKSLGEYDSIEDAMKGAEIASFRRIRSPEYIYVCKNNKIITTFQQGRVI